MVIMVQVKYLCEYGLIFDKNMLELYAQKDSAKFFVNGIGQYLHDHFLSHEYSSTMMVLFTAYSMQMSSVTLFVQHAI